MEGKAKEAFRQVYKLPFHQKESHSWVYDADDNFAFQFDIDDEVLQNRLLDVINGETQLDNTDLEFTYFFGDVISPSNNNSTIITIRGWGRLTGIGGLNLSYDEAGKIQDSLGEFIVEQLNKRSHRSSN